MADLRGPGVLHWSSLVSTGNPGSAFDSAQAKEDPGLHQKRLTGAINSTGLRVWGGATAGGCLCTTIGMSQGPPPVAARRLDRGANSAVAYTHPR